MARTVVTDIQPSFAGGLNTVSDPASLGPTQSRQLKNMRLSNYGAAIKRGGTKAMNNAPGWNPGTAMYWAQKKKLVNFDGSAIYYSDWTNGPSGTLANIAAGATGAINCAAFNDGTAPALYFGASAGDSHFYKFTGSAATTLTGTATNFRVNGYNVYNDRLWGWYWDIAAGSNALFYSNLSQATSSIGGDSLGITASGGGVILVTTFGAANIMACVTVGSTMVIFHETGVSRLTGFGQSDITVQPQSISSDLSLVGPRAVAVWQGVAYALTTRGLARITESDIQLVGTPQIPDPLAPLMATVWSASVAYWNRVTYHPVKNEVWVALPTIGTYIYNVVLGSWSGPWTGDFITTNPAFVFYPGGGGLGTADPAMFLCDGSVFKKVDIDGSYLDGVAANGSGGSSYTCTIQPRRFFGSGQLGAQAGSIAKSWRWANVIATLDASGNSPSITSTALIGSSDTQTFSTPSAAQQTYYNQSSGTGPYLDVVISDTSATQSQYVSVEVEGFAMGRR